MIFQFRAVITLALEKEKSERKIVRFRQGVDLKNDLSREAKHRNLCLMDFSRLNRTMDAGISFGKQADRSTMILDRFWGS